MITSEAMRRLGPNGVIAMIWLAGIHLSTLFAGAVGAVPFWPFVIAQCSLLGVWLAAGSPNILTRLGVTMAAFALIDWATNTPFTSSIIDSFQLFAACFVSAVGTRIMLSVSDKHRPRQFDLKSMAVGIMWCAFGFLACSHYYSRVTLDDLISASANVKVLLEMMCLSSGAYAAHGVAVMYGASLRGIVLIVCASGAMVISMACVAAVVSVYAQVMIPGTYVAITFWVLVQAAYTVLLAFPLFFVLERMPVSIVRTTELT